MPGLQPLCTLCLVAGTAGCVCFYGKGGPLTLIATICSEV